MTKDEVRTVVAAVLSEQEGHIKSAVGEAVSVAFVSFGIHADDRKELRADLQHLRKWRKAVEQGQSMTFRVVITTLATGFLGLVWLGVKTYLGK